MYWSLRMTSTRQDEESADLYDAARITEIFQVLKEVTVNLQRLHVGERGWKPRFLLFLEAEVKIILHELSVYGSEQDHGLPRDSVEPALKEINQMVLDPGGMVSSEMFHPAEQGQFWKIEVLLRFWKDLSKNNPNTDLIQSCIDFMSEERRHSLLMSLEDCSKKLDSLNNIRSMPKPISNPPKEIQVSLSDACFRVGDALISAHSALSSALHCKCRDGHELEARIELSTFQNCIVESSDVMMDAIFGLTLDQTLWKETVIKTMTQNPLESPDEASRTSSTMSIGDQAFKRVASTPRQKIKELCKSIQLSMGHTSRRLSFEIENGQLFKTQSLPVLRFDIGHLHQPTTLLQVLESSEFRVRDLSKRILAVVLSYSFLHLFGSFWLTHPMSKHNVVFLKGTNGISLQPFLSQHLRGDDPAIPPTSGSVNDVVSDAGGDPDDLPLHPYPELVALGILLIEVNLGSPIEKLAKRYNHEIEDNINADYIMAISVFNHIRSDLSDRYSKAIDACLDPNFGGDEISQPLEAQTKRLKNMIYENIVKYLLEDLQIGYSRAISAGGIDKTISNIDISRYLSDQMNTETPKQVLQSSHVANNIGARAVVTNEPMPENQDPGHNMQRVPNNGTSLSTNDHHTSVEMKIKSPESCKGFQIALICALEVEADAVHAVFDLFWDEKLPKYRPAPGDENSYSLGMIGEHNVVLAYMPGMGKSSATAVAAHLRISFPNVSLALVVGVCGGVPIPAIKRQKSIYLGDLIVSTALIQYDFGREYPTVFERKDTLDDQRGRPSRKMRGVLAKLKTARYRQQLEKQVVILLKDIQSENPDMNHPGGEADQLCKPTCIHQHHKCPMGRCGTAASPACESALKASCDELGCEYTKRVRPKNNPTIHFGKMGSADTVMKSGERRDSLAQKDGIIGFEMEGAGVWDYFPSSVVIKGVCDYADSHKTKDWQGYAAAVAAAGMKALLQEWTADSG